MASQSVTTGAGGLIWTLEWQRATARRRLFAFNIVVPLGLVLPVALSEAPVHHAAAVYAVLFTFFGTFGAVIPLLRDAERGLIRRFALLPIGPRRLLVERALAGACIDTLQLVPAIALVVVAAGAHAGPALRLLAALAATLVFTNLLGLWLAAVARSVAEGALVAAVTTLLLLHVSGVFRTASPASAGARIEAIAPFRALHEALLAAHGAGDPAGGAAALASLGLMLSLTALFAPGLTRSLRRADGH
jgi:ABC-2 type transport system permease protein